MNTFLNDLQWFIVFHTSYRYDDCNKTYYSRVLTVVDVYAFMSFGGRLLEGGGKGTTTIGFYMRYYFIY